MKNELHPEDRERFQQLYQQIIEIATGNWKFRQEPTPALDEIDTLSTLLNMTAEEITHIFSEGGNVQRPSLKDFVIILNKELVIKFHTPQLEEAMEVKELVDRKMSDILVCSYIKSLEEELVVINAGKKQYQFVLFFKNKSGDSSGYLCTLTKMITADVEELFHLSGIKHESRYRQDEKQHSVQEPLPVEKYPRSDNSASMRLLMRKVRLYILKNLDRPLPSLKEIGLIHNTNKNSLKEQFKKVYGTSIYQFYNKKRLEKAALLIRSTELPISAVTQQCGFKDSSHFARKFKAQFGHTPRVYRGVASE